MESRIGSFEVVREIGRGGMGVVYLARDPRLDREVAIKALPEHLAADPARMERFEREARLLAGLNHPNVAGIHGVEEQDGARYLVLEYVDGETLAERLDRGPLPVDEAVDYAVQIAAGVEAAHEAGVIHRDLKPANIKITTDGVAKVLDFGLARADDSVSSSGGLDSPTMTTPPPHHSPTIEGAILGTAAYMSPEQARGRRVDKRTDVWSFGVLLYEMLNGVSPFHGETATDSIGAVLHKDLDLEHLPPETPPNVREVLERCLVRNKAERFRDIGDVRLELLRGDRVDASRRAGTGGAPRLPILPAVAGGLIIAAVAAGAGWLASGMAAPEPERRVRKLEIATFDADSNFVPASARLSPAGDRMAYIDGDVVYVRDLSRFDATELAEFDNPIHLEWSPDGRSLAVATRGALFRVPATGGGVTKLGDHSVAFPVTWTSDDRILFSISADVDTIGLQSIPARGGTPQVVLGVEDESVIDYHAAETIPGSDVLLFVKHLSDQRTPIVAWDGTRTVVVADFDDLYRTVPVWSPTGHVLFTRGGGVADVWAVAFSPETMTVNGEPFLVQPMAVAPSVSSDGTLSLVRGSVGGGGEIVWVDPDGRIESIGEGGEVVTLPIVSPDGTRVAYMAGTGPQDAQIWVRDLERGINTRISSLDGFVMPSAWSPDGREIAVMNFDPVLGTSGQRTVFLAADGSGPTRESYPGLLTTFDRDWTTAAMAIEPRGSTTIAAIDLTTMSTIGEVTTAIGTFLWMSLHPDGDLLLYGSRASGQSEIYCTRFPSGDGRWQVSGDGGSRPLWSADGSTVYYTDSDDQAIQVPLTREPEIRFGLPERVFDVMPALSDLVVLQPAPDGERFISVRNSADDTATEAGYTVSIIEHWDEEFQDRESR